MPPATYVRMNVHIASIQYPDGVCVFAAWTLPLLYQKIYGYVCDCWEQVMDDAEIPDTPEEAADRFFETSEEDWMTIDTCTLPVPEDFARFSNESLAHCEQTARYPTPTEVHARHVNGFSPSIIVEDEAGEVSHGDALTRL